MNTFKICEDKDYFKEENNPVDILVPYVIILPIPKQEAKNGADKESNQTGSQNFTRENYQSFRIPDC